MSEPRIIFPRGLTPKWARRMADIAEVTGGDVIDANLYELDPPHCEGCDCLLEAGHCYCCFPISGYGERFQESRHGPDFRPHFPGGEQGEKQ